jgi:hypothetical protein
LLATLVMVAVERLKGIAQFVVLVGGLVPRP